MRRMTVLAALLAAVLVIAACQEREPEVAEEDQVPEDMVGDDDEEPADDEDDADVEADETVEFLAGDLYFEELPDSVSAGTIEFVMENEGGSEHDLVIEELGDEQVVPLTAGGETGSGTAELEPGSYTLYCDVPGHRDQMEETIEVE